MVTNFYQNSIPIYQLNTFKDISDSLMIYSCYFCAIKWAMQNKDFLTPLALGITMLVTTVMQCFCCRQIACWVITTHANMNAITGFILYKCLKDLTMAGQHGNITTMPVDRRVLKISWKSRVFANH